MQYTKQSLRIVFMGTPHFAVASLKALLAAGFTVVAVVTAADKPAGRGMQLQQSAVKQFALENEIPVLQPLKLKDPAFIAQLDALKPHIQVVVAFRMLPEMVWNRPPLGTINVHASLLPQYRGAAPINWAIIQGEQETGVTTFQLRHAIDTGEILLQKRMPIGPDTIAGELHDTLMVAGGQLIVETLEALLAGTLKPIPQENIPAPGEWKHAPKLFTEHGQLDVHLSAQHNHNLVRGLSPVPGAHTLYNGKLLKVYRTRIDSQKQLSTGEWEYSKNQLWLGFADGVLELLEVQPEGKKRMAASAFVHGLQGQPGTT